MSTEKRYDAETEWQKIHDARGPWAAVQDGSTWPTWVRKLDVELQAWIHGEEIIYAEFGCSLDGKLHPGNAVESDGLWAVVFTPRYVAQVLVEKKPGVKVVESADVTVVARTAIESLSLQVIEKPDRSGPPIVTQVAFEGLEGEIQIPANKEEWYTVDPDLRLRMFAELRDDMFYDAS